MANAKVLIVEDEAVSAKMTQRAAEGLGYVVPAVVASGEEAVEKAGQVQPDLVLMDIQLAGKMDGVQAADEIRTRFNIPVVFLTASPDSSTFQRAKATGPFGYIVKPFEEKALRSTIELALYKDEVESSLRERTQELEALYSVSRVLAQPWSFEDKCKGVLEALARIARADLTTMRIMDKGGRGMVLAAQAGQANWRRPETLPAEGTISGKAYQTREAVIANDYPSHPLAEPSAVAQGARSAVSVPIKADRWTLGVINLASRETNHFGPKLVSLLSGIADGLAAL